MIHQVPIKSLPQEWLWCETWCDDASKKRAKTIDLVSWLPRLPAPASARCDHSLIRLPCSAGSGGAGCGLLRPAPASVAEA